MPSVLPPGLQSNKTYAPLADEVNPPFGNVAPAPTVSHDGTIVFSKRISPPASGPSSDEDNRGSTVGGWRRNDSDDTLSPGGVDRKGKGRALYPMDEDAVDIGDRGAHRGTSRYHDGGYDGGSDSGSAAYPPVNDVEEEEKRIQANLAKFTARETARRKAARVSRVLPSPTDSRRNSSAASSSSSLTRSSNRGSVFGYVGTLVGVKEHPPQEATELPPIAQTDSYSNPYDSRPTSAASSPTAPVMHKASPFADPDGSVRSGTPNSSSPEEGGFGYAGPEWRGGATHADSSRPERWWHSLCAWGSDLDGGHGNNDQAGRTNPLE